MNISDLKTGMVIKLRTGRQYAVMKNTSIDGYKDIAILINKNRKITNWVDLSEYNEAMEFVRTQTFEDLDTKYDSMFDIMEVGRPRSVLDMFSDGTEIIWTRDGGDQQ